MTARARVLVADPSLEVSVIKLTARGNGVEMKIERSNPLKGVSGVFTLHRRSQRSCRAKGAGNAMQARYAEMLSDGRRLGRNLFGRAGSPILWAGRHWRLWLETLIFLRQHGGILLVESSTVPPRRNS